MNEREKSGSVRNDLIDTLINLKNEDETKHLSATNVGNFIFFVSISFDYHPTAKNFHLQFSKGM